MVYDKRDRLVMVQDAKLDAQNQWLATIYDNLNRPVLTAFISTSATPATVKTAFIGVVNNATYNTSGSFFGYNVSLPSGYTLTKANILTATYYDNYSFTGIADFNGNYSYGSYNLAGFAEPQSAKTKGLVTGTFTRVLQNSNDIISEPLLVNTIYFDDYGRPIRIVSDNHLGKTDVVYTNYNFAGEITETTTIHNHGQSNQVKLATTYAYDHQGRLLSEKMKINDGTEITLSSYQYNELGEQIAKYLHGSSSGGDFNQKVDYVYNIKGWLRTLNTVNNLGTDLFALDLRYNIPGSGDALTASARYNGNISEMRWDAGTPKGYGFTYDGLSRLTAADYADGSSFTGNQNRYNTSYGYDANGNINTLSRYLNATQIDNLTYTYISSGNRLQSVNDATGNANGYDDNYGTYTYDNNGNLGYDPSKGTYLSYNYLNLPEQVQFGANDNLRYTYDAAGNKLIKVVDGTVAGNNTRLDYSGNFLYENGELKAIFTSAGRIIPFDNNGNIVYKFEYNLQDHLGNTRVVFSGHSNGQPELMQVTDYYPFGMVMNQENYFASSVLSNKYLYNNKELQDDELAGNSLGWYDYGWRMYDPALARWHVVDLLAENYDSQSPYHFSGNNPIKFVDLNGMNYGDYYKENGRWLGSDGIDDDKVYIADGKNTDGSFSNAQELGITHTEFQTISAIIKHEAGTSDADEHLWIAHTANNAANESKTNLFNKLMSGYSSAPSDVKVPLSTAANSAGANAARAGVLNVLSGGTDPTGGSTLWDGTDFLAWGLNSPYGGNPHAKFRQYNNISISGDIYNSYLSATQGKYPKGRVRYYGNYYDIPASVFQDKSNWSNGNFNYKTDYNRTYGIEATGAFGYSIFWKKVK
jgi:RHS repeat-associated protein